MTLAKMAGRSLALITMARFANEDAVANCQCSFYELHVAGSGLPWGSDVLELIDAVANERLPEHVTQRVRARRGSSGGRRTCRRWQMRRGGDCRCPLLASLELCLILGDRPGDLRPGG